MAENPRVALLARPGEARDQLHRALGELGANLVAEGDPGELDPVWVAEQSPTLVVVSLEPVVEAALERFETLLAMPDLVVIYDDADVTRGLDGWDLNRWARHFAAKLMGHEAVLPPSGNAESLPERQALQSSASQVSIESDVGASIDAIFDIADVPSLALPIDASFESLDTSEEALEFLATADAAIASDGDFALPEIGVQDSDELTFEIGIEAEIDAETETELEFEAGADSSDEDLGMTDAADAPELAPVLGDFTSWDQPVRFSGFDNEAAEYPSGDLDADVAALVAKLEAFEKTDQRQTARDPDFGVSLDQDQAAQGVSQRRPEIAENYSEPVASTPARFDFSNLSLMGMDEPIVASATGAPAVKPPPLPETITLSLEPTEPALPGPVAVDTNPRTVASAPAAIPGAVLILAGVGGPDAVRQVLSRLPVDLAVPVLLYQHLEVGKQERLVEQLAKISRLPVLLAEHGAIAEVGKVSVLPSGFSVAAEGLQLRFAAGSLVELVAALPSEDSLVAVLSGSEPSLVAAVLSLRESGGTVLTQDPDSCFDPSAAQMLHAQGATACPATEISSHIAARWSLQFSGDAL